MKVRLVLLDEQAIPGVLFSTISPDTRKAIC